MSVDVSDAGGPITPGVPRQLFENRGRAKHYDVSPDGQRFVMSSPPSPLIAPTELRLVLNWPEALK